jgi:hypothetical protein
MKAATIGNFPCIINSIVMDDVGAVPVGAWQLQQTMSASTTVVSFTSGVETNSFGTNYFYKTRGTGSYYMRFTPNIIGAGDYDIYEWHPTRADASASVPHIVTWNGGTTTVYADQRTNAGNWSLLGRFNFAAGTGGSIRVTDGIPESGGVAIVDGLKMVFVAPNPPDIDAFTVLPGGEARLQISGCPGRYSIEAATTLGGWGEVTNFITTTNSFKITLSQPGPPYQFYRAKLIW